MTAIAASTIVQQAFRLMEKTPPSSFDEPTEEAAAAAEQYPDAIRACLEAADWSFASVLVGLPQKTPDATALTDPDMPYLYELPGDLVVIREVGDGRTKWRRDRDGIRADISAPLRLRYTGTIDDEARLPASFRLAVSCKLASLLGVRFLTVQSKLDGIEQRFQAAMRDALRSDARSASDARYDGLDDQDDWVTEARA